jgi:hypothetical protein
MSHYKVYIQLSVVICFYDRFLMNTLPPAPFHSLEKVNAARASSGLERLPNMQQELDAQMAR